MATRRDPRELNDNLAARFAATRRLTLDLAAPLSDADATIQPDPDASPAKWHLAHTTWFLETFVLRDLGIAPFDDRFAYLFNSYYDGEGARHPRARRGMLSRPSLDEIRAWRAHVDEAMERRWSILSPEALSLVDLGVQHEQQHQELFLTDILATFAANPLEPAYVRSENEEPRRTPGLEELLYVVRNDEWTEHRGGIADIGAGADGFSFDCERPRHPILLHPHALAARPVSNAEWAAFIADGGYTTPTLWLSEGWDWVLREGMSAPLYWHDDGTAFTLAGRRERDPAAPVAHVSFYEADAFARWAGARLPREEEWEVSAERADPAAGQQLDRAVAAIPAPKSGLFGSVWEWTGSAFLAHPGFTPAEGTVGEYNGKFMSGQFVLKGASCATPRGHSRASYRNFFPPAARWQFTESALLAMPDAHPVLAEPVDPAFRDDVLRGLAEPIPAIPARWLYDRRGSELFDEITRLTEYYPTRTETALLTARMAEIAAALPSGLAVVEFGAGSATKSPLLLEAIHPAAYVPIDISGDYLHESAGTVDDRFEFPVLPVVADFTKPLVLPEPIADLPKLGFFPGSTIGNFVPRSATDLLRHFRALLGTGARLLIGMDRIKPVERLIAAYDDARGVTAAFNLNLIERINRELGGTIPAGAFVHQARWNDMLGRIEMHLVAVDDVSFAIEGRTFHFATGRSIHTENSHKYGQRGSRLLLLAGGWTPVAEWTDPAEDFALILAEAQPNRFAP